MNYFIPQKYAFTASFSGLLFLYKNLVHSVISSFSLSYRFQVTVQSYMDVLLRMKPLLAWEQSYWMVLLLKRMEWLLLEPL